MTKVRLCFHDRCFDGTASAALFYRFYREQFDAKADFRFSGMTHKAKHPWEDALFDGDENVIVDFKYSNSPRVTWWFDHHQSAFLTPADAEYFKRFPGEHMYYDPEYKSCTKLIATVTKDRFGFDTKPLTDLIHWGDIIDGAQFPTPESATELKEPATQLALVIEAAPENGVPAQIIPELAYRPLEEMVKLPVVAKYLGPLLERHRKSIDILRSTGWRDFLRRKRFGPGRVQQIHSLPLVSRRGVFSERQRFTDPREGVIGHESLEPDNRGPEPCYPGGKIRRRRPSPRVGDLV